MIETYYRATSIRSRAVASLEEAEGHQHSAGGHGVDANKCLPSRCGGPDFFCIFLIQLNSCILMHSLAPKNGQCFYQSTLAHWGNEDFCSPMRPEGPKMPKAESGVGFFGRGSKPHQLGGLAGECCRAPQQGWGRSPDHPKIFFTNFSTQDGLS